MPAFTAAKSKWLTLSGSTVDTVTFPKNKYRITIVNFGTALGERVYVRFDQVDPVVNSDDSFLVRAGSERTFEPRGGAAQVRVVSPGAPAISVEAD